MAGDFRAWWQTESNDAAWSALLQVVIQRFAADPKSQTPGGFCSPAAAHQIGNRLIAQRFLSAPVGPALLGQRNPFALTLADQARSNSAKNPNTDSIRLAIGESSSVNAELIPDEFNAYAAFG